ncbi:MAG: dUTP diphosphatase [Planctomycetota bacterium]
MKSVPLQIARRPGTEDLPLPAYMSEAASGMDVCAAVDAPVLIEPRTVALIPTGLFLAVPRGYEIQVRPRSGLALRHGITVANAPGTIDADYRGEVGILLGNISSEPFAVTRGMRVAQLVVQEVVRAQPVVVEALVETERGAGGFGSSGLH